jgi:autotransporter-associated beta strand protein
VNVGLQSASGANLLNVSSGGVVTVATNLYAGNAGNGTILVSGGTFNVSGTTYVAYAATSTTATINVSAGVLNATGAIYAGNAGKGTVIVSGGTFNASGATYLGYNTGSAGTISVSAGILNATGAVYAGNAGTGTIIVTAGTFNAASGGANIGYGGIGTLALSGGTFNAGSPSVTLAVLSGSTGTLNLSSGGTLLTTNVTGGSGTSTLNLNGGTLVLFGTAGTVGSVTTANVQAGGAVFNTNDGALAVSQSLGHDPGLGGTADGGLTKIGAGTLTLTGSNTYTGGTVINGGTVRANNAFNSLGGGTVAVNSGGTLGGNGVIANGPSLLSVNAGGTITAGVDANTTGNLSAGSVQWNANGTLLVKFSGTTTSVTSNDHLIMSALTVGGSIGTAAGSQFNVSIDALSGTTALPANAVLVLAVDESTGANNPFNASGTAPLNVSDLDLMIAGLTAGNGGGFRLFTQPDTLGEGGYDLDLADAPEPTSLLLAAAAVAPLALGRRRRAPVARTGVAPRCGHVGPGALPLRGLGLGA